MLSGYGLKNSRKVLLVVLVQWCLSEKTLWRRHLSWKDTNSWQQEGGTIVILMTNLLGCLILYTANEV